ncbi:helix-turn-helix transcriptional regulator [Vagococcus fluvialis]|uniref:helix-turn-helix domain-containing protein n=1 Tax=Vagococcus fluvialis TaxID=2738 RepID=UPI001A8D89F0|nr:helix-turn-helix transcriptional regulator [Vagococcus fluvialis]MBO0428371.1 helix-turn-helix transcriptional regulator [Vagococcus fluvialis]
MENTFSDILIKKRQEKNMSQEELSNKLFVSRQTISKWEKGDSVPDIDKVKKIADIFEIDLNYLISGEKETKDLENRLENLENKVTILEKDQKKSNESSKTNGWDIVKYIIIVIGITIISALFISVFYSIKG